jgi:hypothetical protein
MSDSNGGPKDVKQLAGPGVPGMEDDTPLWHFDVDVAHIPALVSDPGKFFAGTPIAAALAASEEPHSVTFTGGPVIAGLDCCYHSGSQTICHPHLK